MTKKTRLLKKYPITFPVTFAELKLLKAAAKGWGLSVERFAKTMAMASAGGDRLPTSHPVASCPWTRFKEMVEKDPPGEMMAFEFRPKVGEGQARAAVYGIRKKLTLKKKPNRPVCVVKDCNDTKVGTSVFCLTHRTEREKSLQACVCGCPKRTHTGLGGPTNPTACLTQGCPCPKYQMLRNCSRMRCQETQVPGSLFCRVHRDQVRARKKSQKMTSDAVKILRKRGEKAGILPKEREICEGCGHGSKKHSGHGLWNDACAVKDCGCQHYDDERK